MSTLYLRVFLIHWTGSNVLVSQYVDPVSSPEDFEREYDNGKVIEKSVVVFM